MKYTISGLRPNARLDLTLMRLHLRIFRETAPVPVPSEDGYWFGAFSGEEIVAFAALKDSPLYPGSGYFSRVGVLPAHRGNGLQQRLTGAALSLAEQLGMDAVYSDTTDNPHSDANMVACGFSKFRPAAPWAFNHSFYWRRKL